MGRSDGRIDDALISRYAGCGGKNISAGKRGHAVRDRLRDADFSEEAACDRNEFLKIDGSRNLRDCGAGDDRQQDDQDDRCAS